MKALKVEEAKDQEADSLEETTNEVNNKKRKAESEDEEEDTNRKRTKPVKGTSVPALSATQAPTDARPPPLQRSPTDEFQIPSRPATPLKTTPEIPKRVNVDEDEWAAFEADIAAAEVPTVSNDAVISAPAITAAELARKSTEEANLHRKQKQEADLEGEKEDAARKLEEQLDEMESLEQRVKRLREKREELRKKESKVDLQKEQIPVTDTGKLEDPEEDSDEDDEDDDWDGFRMR